MTTTWEEIFSPTGMSLRQGQTDLGNKIIQIIEQGGILVAQASTGTGKSLATSIPTINKINTIRKADKFAVTPRSVISTETITLQNQLCNKDLPFLQKVYGGFTFAKLMGRSNYLCLNRFMPLAVGNLKTASYYKTLDAAQERILTGDYDEVCQIVGTKIDKDHWADMVGTADDCPNNADCKKGQGCWGTQARIKASTSDIVVVNHALLAADAQSKARGSKDGILGPVDILVVDEAHKLEEVLVDQWTKSTTEWEVNDALGKVGAGVKHVPAIDAHGIISLLESYQEFFEAALDFFAEIAESRGQDWKGSETKFALHYLIRPSESLKKKMNKYETLGPAVLAAMETKMAQVSKDIFEFKDSKNMESLTKVAKKEVNKAQTAADFLSEFCGILAKAIDDKDGIVSHMGTTYGVVADGWVRTKDNSKAMTIRCFPIDVSKASRAMFDKARTTVLLSATMTDLTDGSFKYFKRSLGVQDAWELDVKSPFNMQTQQLVYVTQAKEQVTGMSKFSVEELVELINASDGRALILFTSRFELNMAKEKLLEYKIAGRMPYVMLVQEKDSDKAKLVEEFKEDKSSILLGLKSFFTGIDIPGEALSQVIICRWPLPRFSTETRMKMDYWRRAGFSKWYERESLTVFQQAAGRLIRTDKCIGVVSLIDQRVYDPKENVFKSAKLGVDSLGSRVIHDPRAITQHLMKVDHETV